jgi:hypothetical protein
VSQASIDRERKELLEQLTVVSKRVFRLILERQTSCTMQLQQIVAVQVRHVLGSPRVLSIYVQCYGSGFNGVPGSVSGPRRAKITYKNRKKLINFIF